MSKEKTDEERYAQVWKGFRLRGRIYWVGIWLCIFLGFVLINVAPLGTAVGVTAGALFIPTAWYTATLYATKCPRCGKPFAGRGLKVAFSHKRRAGAPPSHCAYCKLIFGAPNYPVEQDVHPPSQT